MAQGVKLAREVKKEVIVLMVQGVRLKRSKELNWLLGKLAGLKLAIPQIDPI